MSALAAIHAKRRHIPSLKDDDSWRAFVERHTGQRSTRGLTPKQTRALLAALDQMGAPSSASKRAPLQGPYAKKIQALWIACWNLGIVKSRDDRSLNAFAVKQSGVGHANWIRDPQDARSVVEALKKMLERHGVNWAALARNEPSYMDAPGFRIAAAQLARLYGLRRSLREYVAEELKQPIDEMTGDDWIIVMNDLGRQIRAGGAD